MGETDEGLPLASTEQTLDRGAFYGTTLVIKSDLAETVAERERQREPQVRAAAKAAAEEARLKSLRAECAPVSFARLRSHTHERTLRGAATELLEYFQGKLEVVDGHTVVSAPAFDNSLSHRSLREIVEVLVAAGPEIVALAKRPGPVDPAKLPDRVPSAAGGLL